jgi:hypothetical protein
MEREKGMGLIAISLTTRSETDFPIFNPKLNYLEFQSFSLTDYWMHSWKIRIVIEHNITNFILIFWK